MNRPYTVVLRHFGVVRNLFVHKVEALDVVTATEQAKREQYLWDIRNGISHDRYRDDHWIVVLATAGHTEIRRIQ